jgi:selenocysteine lyase/cysteine desulfurase
VAAAVRDGNLRLSVHVYNHEDDVAQLVRALSEVCVVR